ncbi:MAG: TRAP transporter substrate-binding protein [Beijerinckiaceae bacterium]
MQTRTITLRALAAGALAATVAAGAAEAQTQTVRMHTFVPPVAGTYKNLDWWRQKVEKDSGGALKIQLFGSMQLGGKASDLYTQTKNGVVDIGWVLPGYTAGLVPRLEVFELPFIGDTAEIVSPAVDDYVRKWGDKEWGDVHVIVAHSAGESVIHTKKAPIKTLADFKGLKIRTPSRISTEALKALGATPVPIPGLKMTEAFMRNVVDGVVAPWSISRAIRVIDAAKFHTESPIHEPTFIMMMNKNSYAKLNPAAKKAIDMNSGAEIAKALGARWMKDDLPAVAKAKQLKNTIVRIEGPELKKWRAAMQPVYDGWVKEMTAKGHPGKELLASAEALVEKYQAMAKKK